MTLLEIEAEAAKNPSHHVVSVELLGTGADAHFNFINPPKSYLLVLDPIVIDTGYLCILEDLDYVAPTI